ncbi:MarR family winged helix-turn-helix transcriptional regulator [Streptomyces sp. NPDC026672]|uniref:MarR family winged helix-turn-helix transcriptional regulator n=1 Tax=unclassified Streptomyces TaxID=2593676 RepID=UPI00340770DD
MEKTAQGNVVFKGVEIEPLAQSEEQVWRQLMRIMIVLPRASEADLVAAGGLSGSEYAVLMHLSEAPQHAMRMIDLAGRLWLSQSAATRIVERLCRAGLVARRPSEYDKRGQVAVLTEEGHKQLEASYPGHLASVRRLVFDRLRGIDLGELAAALAAIAADEPMDRPTDRITSPGR